MGFDGGGQIDEGIGFRSVVRWDSDLDVGGPPDGGEQIATGRLFSKPADPVDFVARAGGSELRWLVYSTAERDRRITPCGGVTPRLDLSSFSVEHSRRQVGHQCGADALRFAGRGRVRH